MWPIRELMLKATHGTSQYANNRAEQSHEPKRVRERGTRKFKSMHQAHRFLNANAEIYNFSIFAVIWFQLRITDIFGCVHSHLGERQRGYIVG